MKKFQENVEETHNRRIHVIESQSSSHSATSASDLSSEEDTVEKDNKDVKHADITERGCTDSGIKSGTTCEVENTELSSVGLSKDAESCARNASTSTKIVNDLKSCEDDIEADGTLDSTKKENSKLLTVTEACDKSDVDESAMSESADISDKSRYQNDSHSLTKSDIEADVLEGKRKVLHKVKVKQEPKDTSASSCDNVVVKQEAPEEYNPTFVVKTDWYTICTQSQVGKDKGKYDYFNFDSRNC